MDPNPRLDPNPLVDPNPLLDPNPLQCRLCAPVHEVNMLRQSRVPVACMGGESGVARVGAFGGSNSTLQTSIPVVDLNPVVEPIPVVDPNPVPDPNPVVDPYPCTACGHRMAHRKWKET